MHRLVPSAFHGYQNGSSDDRHGNTLTAHKVMGSPLNPTETQVRQLSRKTALGAHERYTSQMERYNLTLSSNALLLIKLGAHPEDVTQ
jgi:hypothetical protein